MKPLLGLVSLSASLCVLGGCPSDETNPAVLWLALDGSELQVKLVDQEPRPF